MLTSRQNGYHFLDETFNCIIICENIDIGIHMSLTFVAKGSNTDMPVLYQLADWLEAIVWMSNGLTDLLSDAPMLQLYPMS